MNIGSKQVAASRGLILEVSIQKSEWMENRSSTVLGYKRTRKPDTTYRSKSKLAANTIRMEHRNSLKFHFPIPYSDGLLVSYSVYDVSNWSFFLQTPLSDKQQGY